MDALGFPQVMQGPPVNINVVQNGLGALPPNLTFLQQLPPDAQAAVGVQAAAGQTMPSGGFAPHPMPGVQQMHPGLAGVFPGVGQPAGLPVGMPGQPAGPPLGMPGQPMGMPTQSAPSMIPPMQPAPTLPPTMSKAPPDQFPRPVAPPRGMPRPRPRGWMPPHEAPHPYRPRVPMQARPGMRPAQTVPPRPVPPRTPMSKNADNPEESSETGLKRPDSDSATASNATVSAAVAVVEEATPMEERQWFYKDASGMVQGPYSSSVMSSWSRSGFFPAETMVRSADETSFTELGNGMRLIMSSLKEG
ncbi:unnamed protein product [Durusdinium trenchii]|uniref:GYF domain-containing protein n=3 Tax=Durusdinium trenchii TaxID=1381693 RepID=A0ABP0KR68_9DINO